MKRRDGRRCVSRASQSMEFRPENLSKAPPYGSPRSPNLSPTAEARRVGETREGQRSEPLPVLGLTADKVSDEIPVELLDDIGIEAGFFGPRATCDQHRGLPVRAATSASLDLKRAAAWT